MNPPLVSVIVPAYNGERYLAGALASVQAQTYRPLEIVVVDDGSTDGTAQIAQGVAGVRYVAQANQGNAAARNVGVGLATGDLLAFLDQDDRWLPDKLTQQVAYLTEHPTDLYVICQGQMCLEEGATLPTTYDPNLLLHPSPGYFPSALLARRAAFETIGPFDTTYRLGSDADWFFRAADMGFGAVCLPEVLVEKWLHADNLGHSLQGTKTDLFRLLRSSIKRKRQGPDPA